MTTTAEMTSKMMMINPMTAEGYRLISLKVFLIAFMASLHFLLAAADFDPRIDKGIDEVKQENGDR